LSFFKREKRDSFFITKNFDKKITKKSNLILSPEFYWVKRVSLNVNFVYEVKKMAPSLFDGMLPNGEFKFLVFKVEKNSFIVIAYDIDSIKKTLITLGIDIDLVEKVYLAQSEFVGSNLALRVSDTCGIVMLDGVVVYTCLDFIDTNISVDDAIKEKKLTNNYIYSYGQQKINIEPKHLTLLLWILFFLNLIFVLDIVKLNSNNNQLLLQKENFIQENSLPQTSFQLKSIQDELKLVDKTQIDLREDIHYLSKFKLEKKEYFKSIIFSNNTLKYKLETSKKEKFQRYLSNKNRSSIKIEADL